MIFYVHEEKYFKPNQYNNDRTHINSSGNIKKMFEAMLLKHVTKETKRKINPKQ